MKIHLSQIWSPLLEEGSYYSLPHRAVGFQEKSKSLMSISYYQCMAGTKTQSCPLGIKMEKKGVHFLQLNVQLMRNPLKPGSKNRRGASPPPLPPQPLCPPISLLSGVRAAPHCPPLSWQSQNTRSCCHLNTSSISRYAKSWEGARALIPRVTDMTPCLARAHRTEAFPHHQN